MTCAVIDTNVIVSAQLTRHDDAATRKIVKAVFDRRIVPVVAPAIFAEYREVLSRPAFGIFPEVVDAILGFFASFGRNVNPIPCKETLPDEKDRVFIESALAVGEPDGKCWLVTGNIKHFPALDFVVSPAYFCEIAGL